MSDLRTRITAITNNLENGAQYIEYKEQLDLQRERNSLRRALLNQFMIGQNVVVIRLHNGHTWLKGSAQITKKNYVPGSVNLSSISMYDEFNTKHLVEFQTPYFNVSIERVTNPSIELRNEN